LALSVFAPQLSRSVINIGQLIGETESSDDRSADLAALAILTLLILWFCSALIFSDQVPFFRDLANYFYPLRFSLYESYKSGELPLWNRHFAQGFPLLAAFQPGVFYPPHIILLFCPFFVAIRALFVLHFLIAAIGAYLLMRRWRYSCYLSIVGALLFTLAGTIVSLSNLLNHFQAAVWLPWVILTWERALHAPSWRSFVIFTVVSSVQFLGGSPELFAMSMALVVLDGLRIRSIEPMISYQRIVGFFFAGILLVMAITTAQILPTLELILQSRRLQTIPAAEALQWSFNPLSLVNLFFLDKEIDQTLANGTRLFFARRAPLLISSYMGALSLFCLCLWCFYSTIRERIIVIALVAVSLIIAFGDYTPIFPYLFRHVPLVSALRFPEKCFFLTYALLFYMTIKGLREYLNAEEKSIKAPSIILGSICLVWLAIYLVCRFNSDILADFVATRSGVPPLTNIHAGVVASVLANLERQVILSGGIFAIFWLVKTKAIRLSLFSVLLVSVVYVDLTWAHRSYLFPLRADFVDARHSVIPPAETGMKRVFYYPLTQNLHPHFLAVLGRPSFKEAIALSFQNLLPNAGILYGVDYMQEIDALGRQPYTDFLYFASHLEPSRQVKLFRALNIGYLVSFQPLSAEGITLKRQFPEYYSWLYEVDNPIPRAYIVGKSTAEQNPDKTLRRLSSDEFDPTGEVILDREITKRPTRPSTATSKIVRYDNHVVTIQTSANDQGILVLADSYYPGWKAYVDGKETPILRANHFFRAVALPEGAHVVEFKYDPLSFKIGAWISVLTIISLLAITLFVYVRGRKIPFVK
jgi:hypothetical protein